MQTADAVETQSRIIHVRVAIDMVLTGEESTSFEFEFEFEFSLSKYTYIDASGSEAGLP